MPESLSIIIPARNEERRIGTTLREYAAQFPDATIIVVLNGCTDKTDHVVRLCAATSPNIKVLEIRSVVGKGGAVRAGFLLSRTPIVAFVDADGAFPARELQALLAALGDNDAVIGSRWMRDSAPLSALSLKRRVAGVAFNVLVRLLFGLPFGDTQCGAKVFRAAALDRIFDRLESSGFAFDVDLLYQLNRQRAKIVQRPVTWRDVVGSKVSIWRAGVHMAASVVRLRLRHSLLRDTLPLYDLLFPTQPLYFYEQLKILILNWRDQSNPAAGGAELYLHELAKRWVRMGHHVAWLTSSFPGAQRVETKDGITFHRFGNRLTLYVLAPLMYVHRFRNSFHVVVDSENTLPFFSPLFSMKPKVLLMYQLSRRVISFETHRMIARCLAFVEERVLPLVYRRVPIVTISDDTARELMTRHMTKKPVQVVKCGVDADLHPGSKATEPTLLYLGRLKRFKRVDLLLRAVSELRAHIPRLHCRIAGSGDDLPRLKALACRLGILRHITFEGHVSETRKAELLQSAWALVLPSVQEGWGMVVTEANACGTTTVGFDVPGVQEVIRHYETGLLVPEGSNLAPALREILEDHVLRRSLEEAAHERARQLSWDSSAAQMLHVLRNLVAKSPASLLRARETDSLHVQFVAQPPEIVSVREAHSTSATKRSPR